MEKRNKFNERFKEILDNVAKLIGYIVIAAALLYGTAFVIDKSGVMATTANAETSANEIIMSTSSSTPRIDYTRVYVYGEYYLVFYSIDNSYGIADIEVVKLN